MSGISPILVAAFDLRCRCAAAWRREVRTVGGPRTGNRDPDTYYTPDEGVGGKAGNRWVEGRRATSGGETGNQWGPLERGLTEDN